MSDPHISVLMPVFNTAKYLQKALDSISCQTHVDFELVVIDDGSRDDSPELLKSHANKDDRMRLVLRENLGLIATRNELLRAARGGLVAWMDSDDISLPHRLALQSAAFAKDPRLVCLGGAAQCIDPNGEFLNVERYPLLHQEILLDQETGGAMRFPTTMMRRDVALQVGGFREPFKIGEDFDLLLRLSEVGKMANLPETLYLYRQHIASVCATLGPQWATYRDHILDLARERRSFGKDKLQNGGQIIIVSPQNVDKRRFESATYILWARRALINENIPLAWKYSFAAIGASPTSLAGWRTAGRVLAAVTAATFARKRGRGS
jgi:glycosyltransferase involved in cell wall biosynthesis